MTNITEGIENALDNSVRRAHSIAPVSLDVLDELAGLDVDDYVEIRKVERNRKPEY